MSNLLSDPEKIFVILKPSPEMQRYYQLNKKVVNTVLLDNN
jgi:hypothetical protein